MHNRITIYEINFKNKWLEYNYLHKANFNPIYYPYISQIYVRKLKLYPYKFFKELKRLRIKFDAKMIKD